MRVVKLNAGAVAQELLESNENNILVSYASADIPHLRTRFHDVCGAVARFRAAHAALTSGYKFDDASGAKMLGLLADAVQTLTEETNLLQKIYPISDPSK